MKRIFLGLVISSFTVYVIWFCMPYFANYLYDNDTLDALTWSGHGAVLPWFEFLPFAFLLAFGVTTVGLVYFKKWGRTGFLVLTLFSLLYMPGTGLSVQTGLDSFLGYIVNMCDGAILAMAFLTGISKEFETAS